MKKLLRIDCSPRLVGSHARELANYFEEKWTAANQFGIVLRRDLVKNQLPHIQDNTIKGFYAPAEKMTQEIKIAAAEEATSRQVRKKDVQHSISLELIRSHV